MELAGVSVLLVEDDEDTRNLLRRVLESAGAVVREAPSPIEAMEHFLTTAPDLVISDIGMPGEDGYSLMQKIRSFPAGRSVPAIALTAFASELDKTRASHAGFDVHLSKPVGYEVLLDVARHLVNSDSLGRKP
jgi:CheY-like chemotaxis protein